MFGGRSIFSQRIDNVLLLLLFAFPGGRVESRHHQLEICPLPGLVLLSLILAPTCYWGIRETHPAPETTKGTGLVCLFIKCSYRSTSSWTINGVSRPSWAVSAACFSPQSCWESASCPCQSEGFSALQRACCSPSPAGRMHWSALLSSLLKNKEILFSPRSFPFFPF